ncbi:hypothetical protein TUM17384_14560 [Shewanella algae]|nr:hypothetical protein TUM17384_14560 [Shewanella algae]
MGGSYLSSDALSSRPTIKSLNAKYGEFSKFIDIEDPYYDFNCTDPATVISNRGIRFTAGGSDLISDKVINLKPFYGYRLT